MKPKPFVLCFESHRADGKVWAVKAGRSWQLAAEVSVSVPMQTVYLGADHRQPRAYLTGMGVVRADHERLTITSV